MQDCLQAMQAEDNLKKEDLLCRKCIAKTMPHWGEADCEEHGNEFIDWKCMYCCSMAIFICVGGSMYFC